MLPNQLLNQHLDNVAVRLRNPKPFTPNDFPAVKRIEQEIRDLPIEHGYGFDSTGMPISHDIGVENSVDPENLRAALRETYELDEGTVFSAPVALYTHNHPSKITPLSKADLEQASGHRIPIRAVASKGVLYRNDGQVTEFSPGSAEKYKLFEAIENNSIPTHYQHIDHEGVVNAIEREDYQRRKKGLPGYSQLATYEIHDMEPYAAAAANFPTMASDSFAIRRVPTADEAAAVLGVIPTSVRGASQSAYASRHATPEQLEALKRSPSTASGANAYDPDAIHRAKMNAAASQGKWNGGGVYGSYGYRDW